MADLFPDQSPIAQAVDGEGEATIKEITTSDMRQTILHAICRQAVKLSTFWTK